ncbi:MAG: hypothetical protein OXF33_11055 [Rhodospirillales bacterium]|nr:hypothetical protein [Rhodospirillales bacterium]
MGQRVGHGHFGGGRIISQSLCLVSIVTLAIMSLWPPSGLNQPTRRQNSLDNAWQLGGEQRAQVRRFCSGEVTPVEAALDLAGHAGAVKLRLRSSLIDHGSQSERSSGGWPPLFLQT